MSKLPIAPLTMPSTLKGQQNGKLEDRLLTKIGVTNARMEITAARAFKAMFSEARKAGFDVRHVGDYRPFEQQLSLFLARYQPATFSTYTLTAAAHRKIWNQADQYGYKTKYWVKKKNANGSYPATAATPGNSNHGWGLALDIAQELDGDPTPESISPNFVEWLIRNAARYGISAELQSEPWHWRYVAGDRIPQAVYDFETGVEPAPPAPIFLKYPGQPVLLGSRGDAAKVVQHVVGAKVDGWFGPQSVEALRDWQRSRGLEANGICDEPVWKLMFP